MSHAEDDTIASSLPTAIHAAGAATAAPELIAGRYQIVRWLGSGGMGRVYAAVDTELGENVALKVLRDGLSDDAIERFRREVRLTRRIQHRNVARMFDIGEHGGAKFLTMELVHGVSLSEQTKLRGIAGSAMPWSRLAPIAAQLCEGLAAAHAAGVVHRDLKPDNVLIESGTERAVITDFGIARSLDDAHVTQVGAVIGTPRYMSPEQLAGGEVDARSDLFALGVMLYELATGARPWQGDNAITIAVSQVTQAMRPLRADHTPPEFLRLVESCLAIAPERRPSSAREVAEGLSGGGGGGTSATRIDRPVAVAAPVTAASPRSSLAVMPVTCAAGDEYLADGMLDDLIDQLSSSSIRVRPAGMVRSLDAPDPRAIGRALEVDHVATVALRRTPAALRISARLISVSDGFQIWAHRLDCEEANVLAVAEQLAQGIAQALSTRAAGGGSRPTDPRAVDLYLRARAELRRFWGPHAANAAELLDRAVAVAPDSAPILAAHALASVQAWVMTTNPAHAPRARAALERGLATGHGEAYLASAIYKWNRNDPEAAAVDFATAIARSPMSSPAHEITARMLVEVEGLEEARAQFETALGLDPGRAQVIGGDLARLDALGGDFASAARRVAPIVADPDPSVAQLGSIVEARLAAWRGDSATMLEAATRFAPRMGENGGMIHDFIVNMTRDPAMFASHTWRQFLGHFDHPDRPSRQQLMGLQLLTEVALSLSLIEPALETVAAAADRGLIDVVWIDRCPLFLGVATQPRFRAVRAQVAERAARVLAAFHRGDGVSR